NGPAPAGAVWGALLRADPAAAFGVGLDADAVTRVCGALWSERSVVLVEASDLVRAGDYASVQAPAERVAALHRALVVTDELVGRLLQYVDAARDAVFVVAPGRSAGTASLMVAAVRRAGVVP